MLCVSHLPTAAVELPATGAVQPASVYVVLTEPSWSSLHTVFVQRPEAHVGARWFTACTGAHWHAPGLIWLMMSAVAPQSSAAQVLCTAVLAPTSPSQATLKECSPLPVG
jgi:hypothetical protein